MNWRTFSKGGASTIAKYFRSRDNPIQHGVEARHVFFGNRHDIDAQFHSLCPLVLRPRVSREHQVKRRTIQSPNLGESWPSATRIRIYGG